MKKVYKIKNAVTAIFGLAFALNMNAQCVTCGTGTDGVFHATTNTTLAGGTYNFSSFTIDPGVSVGITGTNPLIIYSTGAVQIDGALLANGGNGNDGITFSNGGSGGIGIAGGGDGGGGTFASGSGPLDGLSGSGSGMGGAGRAWSGGGGAGYETGADSSGNIAGGFGGPAYSNAQLSPLEAGSGGGGGSGGYDCGAGGGGAGGGMIQIESCISITIGPNGAIMANGGNGGSDGTGNCGGGGGGSGGTIWLRTNGALTNSGIVSATPGIGGASQLPGNPYYGTGTDGKNGRIRFDYNTIAGAGSVNPQAGFTTTTLTASVMQLNNVTCNGACNGAATIVGTGGVPSYTWMWTPTGNTTMSETNLCPGTYTIIVTDATGCSTTVTITIVEPPALSTTDSHTDESVVGGNDGSASVAVSGGTGPYSYLWSPGNQVTPSITGLTAGTYSCTVTDASGCTHTSVFIIATLAGINTITNQIFSADIFPNPANTQVQLTVNNEQKEKLVLEVYNLVGEKIDVVNFGTVPDVNQSYSTAGLTNGVYFFRISSGENTITRKVTVAH